MKEMILLLGKNDLVEQYADRVLGIDINCDLVHYPDCTTHFTEYCKELESIKEENPSVLTSQNIEFIKYLLYSDLDFVIWTVCTNDRIRKMSKIEAINAIECLGLELRD